MDRGLTLTSGGPSVVLLQVQPDSRPHSTIQMCSRAPSRFPDTFLDKLLGAFEENMLELLRRRFVDPHQPEPRAKVRARRAHCPTPGDKMSVRVAARGTVCLIVCRSGDL